MKKFIQRNLIISTLFTFLFISSVSAETFVVDTEKSSMAWIGKKILGKHNGTIKIKSGKVNYDKDGISGTFLIDMTTIANLDIENETYRQKLVDHLKSEDFFSVQKYPASVFKITKSEPAGKGSHGKDSYRISGDLTIKGITHPISFPASVVLNPEGFSALAHFSIDRTKWNIRYGSGSFFKGLGDKAILNEIEFELTIVSKLEDLTHRKSS